MYLPTYLSIHQSIHLFSNRAGSKTTGEEGRPIFYSTVSDFEEKGGSRKKIVGGS